MKKDAKTDGYLHILKYISLFGGVQGLNVFIGIIRNKFIAMLLGPQGVGLISLFNSTTKLIGDSTNFGIPMSAVRNISEDYDRQDEEKLIKDIALVRSWSLITALLGLIICVVFSPLLSRYTFSWDGHTLHFILLSPCVALTALTGGELAILKGIRKLRALAAISVYNVMAALLLTVPLYYFFGNSAIVPSLVLMALVQMILTIVVSYRLYPFRISLRKPFLCKGWGMIRLGTAFVLAGIMGSGAELVIRSYLNNVAEIEAVGFYNAAFMMTMVYSGMIFSAMETDYFPRLSGVNGLRFSFNQTVNRQIEVTLLLISPLLTFFLLFLPQLILFLYSDKFLPALGMAQVLVLAMYMRAVRLPVEYIPLAKGDSRSYLLLEASYALFLVLLVTFGFRQWGIFGAGIGITLAGFLNFVCVYVYAYSRYHYRLSSSVMTYAAVQLTIGLLVFFCVRSENEWIRWGTALTLCVISTLISLRVMKSKSGLWNALLSKIKNKFIRNAKD